MADKAAQGEGHDGARGVERGAAVAGRPAEEEDDGGEKVAMHGSRRFSHDASR
eukprot:m.131426 g.131426  ORF g.131426 m.131426 type:complete len:53 (+) comp13752_c0_seq3:600-758(+)